MPGLTPPAAAERHPPQTTTPAEPLRIGDLASRTDVTVEQLSITRRGLPFLRVRCGGGQAQHVPSAIRPTFQPRLQSAPSDSMRATISMK